MSSTKAALSKKSISSTSSRDNEADLKRQLLENQKDRMQHVRHKPKLNRVRETQLQPDKIMECKQELQSYRIFLYKLDFASESALSRQIKKLGAVSVYVFWYQ